MEPSDEKCKVQSNATFHCLPNKGRGGAESVLWVVNDELLVSNAATNSNTTVSTSGGESQLTFTGCLKEWDGYRVKCVVPTLSGRIFSSTSLLVVEITHVDVGDKIRTFFNVHYVTVIVSD